MTIGLRISKSRFASLLQKCIFYVQVQAMQYEGYYIKQVIFEVQMPMVNQRFTFFL